jgi:hypothetical protein
VTVRGPWQSVAVRAPVKSGTPAWHWASATRVWGGAPAVMAGGVASRTVRVTSQGVALAAPSRTVRVTVVSPNPMTVPAGGVWVRVRLGSQSVARSAPVRSGTRAVQVGPAGSSWAGGHRVMTGAV